MAFFDEFSLTSFVARNEGSISGVFVLDSIIQDTDSAHAALFDCDMKYAREKNFFNRRAVGIAFDHTEQDVTCVLEQWGIVYRLQGEEVYQERLNAERGPMMRIREINGSLYAVGSSLQAFRRAAPDTWQPIGPSSEEISGSRLTILTDIDGFSSEELYASGTNGTIWFFFEGRWQEVNCATNLAFHAIHCGEDGSVYACGQLGLLARGRGSSFELISPNGEALSDLWDVSCFEGTVYCSSMRSLFELKDGELEPHMPAMKQTAYFHLLQVSGGVLWSCGEKSILRFDGRSWEQSEDLVWIPRDSE